jgi:hypothetical protein
MVYLWKIASTMKKMAHPPNSAGLVRMQSAYFFDSLGSSLSQFGSPKNILALNFNEFKI